MFHFHSLPSPSSMFSLSYLFSRVCRSSTTINSPTSLSATTKGTKKQRPQRQIAHVQTHLRVFSPASCKPNIHQHMSSGYLFVCWSFVEFSLVDHSVFPIKAWPFSPSSKSVRTAGSVGPPTGSPGLIEGALRTLKLIDGPSICLSCHFSKCSLFLVPNKVKQAPKKPKHALKLPSMARSAA